MVSYCRILETTSVFGASRDQPFLASGTSPIYTPDDNDNDHYDLEVYLSYLMPQLYQNIGHDILASMEAPTVPFMSSKRHQERKIARYPKCPQWTAIAQRGGGAGHAQGILVQ